MLILLLILITFISVLYFTITRKTNYWKNKNIPHEKPLPLVGNFMDLWLNRLSMPEVEKLICDKYPDEPLVGAYYGTEPCLIVKDPDIIKTVTTKDFYYFSNREISEHSNKELLTRNLFQTNGDEWRILRQNLTPIFSSAKMKKMFYLIEQCSKTFEKVLDREVKDCDVFEMKELMARFTMDCMGTCAFGLNTQALDGPDKTKNPFRKIAKVIFDVSYGRFFMTHSRAIFPSIFYTLGLTLTPKSVSNFFSNLLLQALQDRKPQSVVRNDFIDLILSFEQNKTLTGDSMKSYKYENKEQVTLKVDDDILVAQCFVFFAAGFETSASTSSFLFYELAKNQDVQDRVCMEIDKYLEEHDNKLGYECISELKYLDQCIDETLRLYPILGVITREVAESYTFPETGLTLEKGMRVHLPTYYIQRDPKYFPDPEKYLPERFSPECKKNIKPYTYFPFGEGPRICIGMRFAKMQMISGMVTILKKYRVELADGMSPNMKIHTRSVTMLSANGIKLKFIPRTDRDPIMFS